jgi:hypothetical protein
MPFDFAPHGVYNLTRGSDGYDVYGIRNGVVSGWNTQDGGGYSTTFFSPGCTVGNGWVFFPATGFLTPGTRSAQISGVYWQQRGESFPGSCPSGYGTAGGSWETQTYTFGGLNGNTKKTLETIVSIHGFQNTEQFRTKGHLEVFYFTREYGITRWEVWRPVSQNPTRSTTCANVDNRTYNGMEFLVTHCRDWSNVKVATSTQAGIPLWPIPKFNVIKASHFDDTFLSHWQRGGTSPAGNLINWSLKNSNNSLDTKYAPQGVRFLATNCGAGADGQCGAPDTQMIYQDIPVSAFVNGHIYGYGANLRLAQGHTSTGTMRIALQILDNENKVLQSFRTDATVRANNGVSTDPTVIGSVYRTAAFAGDTAQLTFPANAAKVRFILAPLTPQTFEVVNVWLAPWPKPSSPLSRVAFAPAENSILTNETTTPTVLERLDTALAALDSFLSRWRSEG